MARIGDGLVPRPAAFVPCDDRGPGERGDLLRGDGHLHGAADGLRVDRVVVGIDPDPVVAAELSGTPEVDFSKAIDWSAPPKFPWTDTPPPGVKLPSPD